MLHNNRIQGNSYPLSLGSNLDTWRRRQEPSATELAKVSGTELAKVSGTELAKVSGTELAKVSGTELAKVSGTELVKLSGTAIELAPYILPECGRVSYNSRSEHSVR